MKELQWKRLKDQIAAEEERARRSSARAAAFMKRRSKVSKRAQRVQADVEEKLLKKMADKMAHGHRFALTDITPAEVAAFVSSTSSAKRKRKTTRRLTTISGRLNREANKRIFLIGPWNPRGSDYGVFFPVWDHIAPLTRAMCYGMAIPAGQRFALTLHLTQDITDKALTSSKGFAGYLQDRLRRFLRNATPEGQPIPEFTFIVEGWGQYEDLHLHGAINLTPRLATIHRETIRIALRAAAGFKKDRKLTGGELDMPPVYEAAGWFRYLGKRRMVTVGKIAREQRRLSLAPLDTKEHLIVASKILRQDGKKWFEEARKSGNIVLWNRRVRSSGST